MLCADKRLRRGAPRAEQLLAVRAPGGGCGCNVDAVLSIDERGQMVLPKEVREKAGFAPGEKLAVVSFGDDTCCIALIKTSALGGMVKNFLGPVMRDVMG